MRLWILLGVPAIDFLSVQFLAEQSFEFSLGFAVDLELIGSQLEDFLRWRRLPDQLAVGAAAVLVAAEARLPGLLPPLLGPPYLEEPEVLANYQPLQEEQLAASPNYLHCY